MTQTSLPILDMSSPLARPAFCRLADWTLLRVSGEDAASFLQGQSTCDISALADGELGCGAFCTPKGRVIATARLARWGNAFYLLLPADLASLIQKRLQMYVLRSRAGIEDLSSKYLLFGAMGPGIEPALCSAGLRPPQAAGLSWSSDADGGILKLTGDLERFILLVPADKNLTTEMTGQLQAVHPDTWKLSEIEAGFPWVTRATSEAFLPQMLNLDMLEGISFNKGCYTGQEIVTRTHFLGQLKRRMFRLCAASGSDLAPGSPVCNVTEGETVTAGHIVNACRNARGELECLAVLGLEFADSPDLHTTDSQGLSLRRLPLPYPPVT